jgi:hypothetical protein
MTDEITAGVTAITAPLGFSIDPATYVEPKEQFPGIVETSTITWAREKYETEKLTRIAQQNEITLDELRAALGKANVNGEQRLPVYQLDVRRFDVIFQRPDGSQAPVLIYAGWDMLNWSNRNSAWQGVSATFGKAAFVGPEWARVAGQLHPPEILASRMFEFDFWQQKRLGKFPTGNVLVPTKALAPDYQYTGDVRIALIKAEAETTPGDTDTAGVTATTVDLSLATHRIITEILPGLNVNSAATIVQAVPPELRLPELMNSIALGEFTKNAEAEGRIMVAADGTITLPV